MGSLLALLPTAEEVEVIKENSAHVANFGRVERFFYEMSQIDAPGRRLKALQVTHQFAANWQRLVDQVDIVREACSQIRASHKLRLILHQVLQIGNYLNGATSRGGAVGFRLADLEKLSLVKSADLRWTLLHYIARLPCASDLQDLKELQRVLTTAKSYALSEMKPELGPP